MGDLCACLPAEWRLCMVIFQQAEYLCHLASTICTHPPVHTRTHPRPSTRICARTHTRTHSHEHACADARTRVQPDHLGPEIADIQSLSDSVRVSVRVAACLCLCACPCLSPMFVSAYDGLVHVVAFSSLCFSVIDSLPPRVLLCFSLIVSL